MRFVQQLLVELWRAAVFQRLSK